MLRDQLLEPNLGLPEQLARRDAVAGRRPNGDLIERPEVAFEPAPAPKEPLPPLVIHEPGLAAARRQPEIGIVDAQQQPMLRAGREHPVGLQAPLRDQVVDENADVCLVAAELERLRAPRPPRRVDPGDDPLRARLPRSRTSR